MWESRPGKGVTEALHWVHGLLRSVDLGSALIALGPHRGGQGAVCGPDCKAGGGSSRVARWVAILRIQKVMK